MGLQTDLPERAHAGRRGRDVLVTGVSTAVAVGAGHLVGGLVAPASSPFPAVADAAVRFAPAAAIELGKSLALPGLPAGVADKVALQVGQAVVLVLVAVVAGWSGTGRLALVGLGLLGLAAAGTSPVFRPSWLLAPLAAVAAGLAVFEWLQRRAREQATRADRRGLLVAFGLAAVGAGLVGQLLANRDVPVRRALPPRAGPAIPPGADFATAGTPTFLTPNRDFYRIDTALRIPRIAAEDWSVRVHGLVDRELTLSYPDLLARPLVDRTITLTCVSNEVNGDLVSTATFTGVDLRGLLVEAGIRPGAQQLLSTSLDGWTAGTPVDILLEPDRGALLAVAMNGEPLPPEHGYPVRMVVPGLYGFVSATKWLADLEITTWDARSAYWRDRGWAREAPVKTQSRIDRPRGFQVVPAGTLTAAGIAWAQPTGISRVEIRLDDGPWRPAVLSTEVSGDTWRMWRADLAVTPGDHFLSCRATDRAGTVQPAAPTPPIPDGAQGWPVINFVAR